jgi:hypothetical protein
MRPPVSETSKVAVLEGPGLLVELIQNNTARAIRDLVPDGKNAGPVFVHGQFKAGFMVADFDSVIATLQQRGVKIAIGPFPASRDQRANAIIRDNAGNYVQIIGDYANPEPKAPE